MSDGACDAMLNNRTFRIVLVGVAAWMNPLRRVAAYSGEEVRARLP